MRRLPVPRLPLGGSLGTPKFLSTGATLHLGPIRLHVENLACRADFFSACEWGFSFSDEILPSPLPPSPSLSYIWDRYAYTAKIGSAVP